MRRICRIVKDYNLALYRIVKDEGYHISGIEIHIKIACHGHAINYRRPFSGGAVIIVL